MTVWKFEGAVVAVTGAASGIGLELSRCLHAAGATTLMLDRDKEKLQSAAVDIFKGAENPASYTYVVDVSDSAAVNHCFDAMEREHGPVTHAVANAGITMATNILTVADNEWHQLMDVNVHGTMYFCRAAARTMVKSKRGAIVLLSSIAGLRAKESRVAYSASKGAIINLTRALAIDLGRAGIRVNSVAPGVTETTQQLINPASYREAQAERTALGRTGKPEEIANAIMFLLSDLASYITGETLVVDGGLTVRLG